VKIAVLIKQVPDTWGDRKLDLATGRVDRSEGDQVIDEIDERALEVALRYRDRVKGTELVVMSMGPAETRDALRKALSFGADAAVHVLDDGLAGADAGLTSSALAGALASGGYDLVVAGNVSTDGRGGVVPAMIAERLGWAHLSSMDVVEISDHGVSGSRAADTGEQTLRAGLPALLSVTERMPEARFPSFKNILAAKKKQLTTLTLADVGVDVAVSPTASSVVVGAEERPQRQGGSVIVDDGTAAEQLLRYLAAERLI
jgi:electron transfer flavoprotein beta subunit